MMGGSRRHMEGAAVAGVSWGSSASLPPITDLIESWRIFHWVYTYVPVCGFVCVLWNYFGINVIHWHGCCCVSNHYGKRLLLVLLASQTEIPSRSSTNSSIVSSATASGVSTGTGGTVAPASRVRMAIQACGKGSGLVGMVLTHRIGCHSDNFKLSVNEMTPGDFALHPGAPKPLRRHHQASFSFPAVSEP